MTSLLRTFLFLAVLLCGCLRADDAVRRLQKAFFETADMQLQDFQNEDAPAQAEERPAVALNDLRPFSEPVFLGIRADAWDAALALAALAAMACAADGMMAWRRWRNSPRQRMLREARRTLRQFVRGGAELSEALDALRRRLELPSGTTLTQVAAAVRRSNPALAQACLDEEAERWSGAGGGSAAAILRKALKPLLAAVVVWGVVGCVGLSPAVCRAFSKWSHGVKLAADGRPAEALAEFLALSAEMPSSQALSQNIAALLTVLPASLETDAVVSPQAWTLHGQVVARAFHPHGDGSWRNLLPEISLAALAPLVLAGGALLCHGRRLSGGVILALALAAAVAMAVAIQPRRLVGQAVAPPGARLMLTPDASGEELATLSDAALVTLDTGFPPCNGCRRVVVGGKSGWMASRHLLPFKL